MTPIRRLLALLGLLVVTPIAYAHPGHLHAGGFAAGFLHPLTGIDHVLFLAGAGLLIALRAPRLGGRLAVAVPATQMLAAVVTVLPVAVPIWEIAIGMSLIALGLLMWSRRVTRLAPVTVVLGASLHAAAHWSGMPAGVSLLPYGLGLAASGALLFGLGFGVGRAWQTQTERAARLFGFSLAGGGLWWLLFA